MTGATGYIGKHILAGLLSRGYRVGVIVRDKGGSARTRVLEALAPFELAPHQLSEACLGVYSGDVTLDNCGLGDDAMRSLENLYPAGFLHCAGLTRFDEHLSDAIFAHNLKGAKNAHQTSEKLGIPHFHHLSTAFVLGKSRKVFGPGDLDEGQEFNNPYEASKFEAEKYLRQSAPKSRGRIHIYRPSIVVGGHALGENNTVSTIYVFLKSMHFIRECCRRDLRDGLKKFSALGVRADGDSFVIPLRVAALSRATINLVSVRQVAERVIGGLLNPPGASPETVAIVGGRDFTLEEVRDAFSRSLAIRGVELVGDESFAVRKRNVFEEKFFRSTKVYLPYMHNAPRFAVDDAQRPDDPDYAIDPEAVASEFIELLAGRHADTVKGSLNSLALDVLGVKDAHDYFERFIRYDLGRSFLKRIPYVDARIRFHISGDRPFDRVIHFDSGRVRFESDEAGMQADCTYVIDQPVFSDIVEGRTDIRQAFFEGKIKIEGDKETGLKFGFLFGEHYRNIDDRVIEEVSA
ncbi:MAG: SDR family oxidoreductase [Gammaproteobacteria bacterium]